jgi:hypothetical protein
MNYMFLFLITAQYNKEQEDMQEATSFVSLVQYVQDIRQFERVIAFSFPGTKNMVEEQEGKSVLFCFRFSSHRAAN